MGKYNTHWTYLRTGLHVNLAGLQKKSVPSQDTNVFYTFKLENGARPRTGVF